MRFKQLSLLLFICLASSTPLAAQSVTTDNWYMSPGIIGTFVLITIVLFIAVIILTARLNDYVGTLKKRKQALSLIHISEPTRPY